KVLSQSLSQPVITAGYGNAIDVVVGTHYAEHFGLFDRCLERWQQDVFNFSRRYLRVSTCLSFACSFANAIDGEVFCGGCNRVILLKALHHLNAKSRREIWIFTVCIFDAAPALIARYVKRWSVDVCVTQCSRFTSSDPSHLANEFRIPGISDAEF